MSRSARLLRVAVLGLVAVCLPAAWPEGASGAERPVPRGQPHIGYAYPAGGQVGKTVKVRIGGMNVRNVEAVHVTGGGIKAAVVTWAPGRTNLLGPQRRTLTKLLRELREQKQATTPSRGRRGSRTRRQPNAEKSAEEDEEGKLPDHPMLMGIEEMSIQELREVARYFFTRIPTAQRKRAIEENVFVRLTIAPDAEPGPRDLRVQTRAGLSNPIRFDVGLLPEVNESEPYPVAADAGGPHGTPIVLNGQILPRDVDRFRIKAEKGQRLVFRADARSLVPYQADSVPGWMQTTLSLYDADGHEVAYADEFRFDPDPVLFYEVPYSGVFELEVRDAISRGRADFTYRITVGELPFITRLFPLGGQQGKLVQAEVKGWNLNWERLPLDTRDGAGELRDAAWRQGDGITNRVRYAVDTLPEIVETEPNNDPDTAPQVELGLVINGRLDTPGDVDVFAVKARGNRDIVVEVIARRLGSPVDSVIRLFDDKGTILAWNDDHVPQALGVRGLGLQTHHADSYLRASIPKTGTYYVRLDDVRRHGSQDHAYRLRISEPRPDVEVYVTPSSTNMPAGRTALVDAHVIRKDGYDGEVDLELVGAPAGMTLGGATIPAGQDHVIMTLTAPPRGNEKPFGMQLQATIQTDGETLTRRVLPADNVMQAFLWRHLVPAEELTVTVLGRGGQVPIVALLEEDPVRVKRGSKAYARFEATRRVNVSTLRFEVIEAPKGISIGEARTTGDGFELEIRASRAAARMDNPSNLIVEAFVEREVRVRGAAAKGASKREKRKLQRYSLGLLPAIPYIVRR